MAADCEAPSLSLSVSLLTGESLSLNVPCSELVGTVRSKIKKEFGVAAIDTVKLMHGDQVLKDDVCLADVDFGGREATLAAIVTPLYVYGEGYYNHADIANETLSTLEAAIERAEVFPNCIAICRNSEKGSTYFVSGKLEWLRENGKNSWHWYDRCE
eukprot:TRINITY_DN40217_c0_g1_i1.p1 TRINITY_DN40217_c0_g1~~TRINITY_DN40217_c0_g1_i1.p1  ORF type:complete len:157 (-),score=24.13 TRINITY_DN40217_c0_g1_i1:174-644(-)